MTSNMLDPNTLAQLHAGYLSTQKKQTQPTAKKGNLFTNLLPAIGGGIGAVAGIPLDIFGGAGSVAGGAVGSSLGEALKEKLTGQKLSAKQIGIQGLEGGATSAFQPLKLLGKASGATKGFVTAGADTAAQTADKTATAGSGKLATQLEKTGTGLRAEGTGIKAGATAPGQSALRPSQADKLQQYLETVPGAKNSAHTQARAVESDLNTSGKQIGDLITQHNRTLSAPEIQTVRDTAQQAASKTLGLDSKDPLIQDTEKKLTALSKNGTLSDAKGLRNTLDDQLKSFYTKEGRNTTTTKAVEKTLKGYRDGIDKVLSDGVPGFKEANTRYANGLKALDFLGKNASPSGLRIAGIQTHVGGEGLQAAKDALGRGMKTTAAKLNGGAVPTAVKATENTTLDSGVLANVKAAGNTVVDHGDTVDIVSKDGSKTTLPRDDFNNLGKSATASTPSTSVPQVNSRQVLRPELEGVPEGALPPDAYQTVQQPVGAGSVLQAQAPGDLESALQNASDSAGQIGAELPQGLPPTSRAAQALNLVKNTATLPARAAVAPLAYPGKSALAVGKQVVSRGAGDLAGTLQGAAANKNTQPGTLSDALQQALAVPDTSQDTTNQSPYTIDDLQYDLARDPTNSSKYIDYYNSLSKIYTPANTQLSGTQATNAANASSALTSLQKIAQTLQSNPDAAKLADLPGGSLISNQTGTGEYKAAIANAKDVISRLRSGAAISASEEKTYTSLLPAAFDSPSTIQYKLQSLGSLLQKFVDPNGTASSNPSNLSDAIMGAQ